MIYEITPAVVLRVLAKTVIPDDEVQDCWEWQGSTTYDGYGHLSVQGKLFLAHRVMFTLFKEPVPEGKVLLHACDNRKCVNPHHLSIGTQAENLQDMRQKGRWARKRRGDAQRQGRAGTDDAGSEAERRGVRGPAARHAHKVPRAPGGE